MTEIKSDFSFVYLTLRSEIDFRDATNEKRKSDLIAVCI